MRQRFITIVSLLLAALMIAPAAIISAQDEQVLTLLYWQAPSTMNAYLSGGTKEQEAMSITNEPLARYGTDGVEIIPYLATDIPTLENGGVSEDLTSITWNLRDDIVWSDGTPFTAADVVFTGEYCMDPDTGCSYTQNFEDVVSIEAPDDYTIVVTFGVPKPNPYGPFVGYNTPILQAAQFADCIGAAAQECTEQNFAPIGTGPYVVEEFRANDVITYVRNDNYRVEGQPFFDRVILKGGGDAESAARAVLETGEADYAWNLQVTPAILNAMEAMGQGQVVVGFAANVERLMLNQANDDPSLDEATRSVYMDGENPHPFLTNATVRQALAMAIDRDLIAEQLYGAGGVGTCNVLNGPPIFASPNTSCEQDIDGANALLDEAGIVDTDGDGIRELDGVPLEILYQTSTNAVRQSTQILIKDWWEAIGVSTELRNIDASVFFGSDVASPDTYGKFYADIEMFTSGITGADPETFMVRWICESMPGPDNNWLGRNTPRHCNPEYDAIFDEFRQTAGAENRAELAIQLNDLLVESNIIIPIVFRGSVSAASNRIVGPDINAFDSELWNIAEWALAG